MWKIYNCLFGFHYVWLMDAGSVEICRVTKSRNGEYLGTIVYKKFIIKTDGTTTGGYGISEWYPLTWGQDG